MAETPIPPSSTLTPRGHQREQGVYPFFRRTASSSPTNIRAKRGHTVVVCRKWLHSAAGEERRSVAREKSVRSSRRCQTYIHHGLCRGAPDACRPYSRSSIAREPLAHHATTIGSQGSFTSLHYKPWRSARCLAHGRHAGKGKK